MGRTKRAARRIVMPVAPPSHFHDHSDLQGVPAGPSSFLIREEPEYRSAHGIARYSTCLQCKKELMCIPTQLQLSPEPGPSWYFRHLPFERADKLPKAKQEGDALKSALILEYHLPNANITPFPPQDLGSDICMGSCQISHFSDPSNPPGDNSFPPYVFVKHWQWNTEVRGPSIHTSHNQLYNALPTCDSVLSVAVITFSASEQNDLNVYDIPIEGNSTPLVIYELVRHGEMSIRYEPERSVLQFFLHRNPQHPPHDSGSCKLQPKQDVHSFLVSKFLQWLVNFRAGARLAESPNRYGTNWIFQAVRRRECDGDASEYQPFMKQVENNSALNVTLRPYQIRAVAWMLSRELGQVKLPSTCSWSSPTNSVLPDSGVQLASKISCDLLLGKLICDDEQQAVDQREDFARGGLLCDEMGLGKTVELMQLVLSNKMDQSPYCGSLYEKPRACNVIRCRRGTKAARDLVTSCKDCHRHFHGEIDAGAFSRGPSSGIVCGDCCKKLAYYSKAETDPSELPQSRATIVVIPTTLLLQWESEIKKHVKDALNIVIFEGLSTSGFIPSETLRNADVVLTTYDALRADIATVNALRQPRTNMRHPKRYFPTPVPLLTMRWHRVALDESQMLGVADTQVAQMASFLHARYRWCVTGTPARSSLFDVVPMLNYVRLRHGGLPLDWKTLALPSKLEEDQVRLMKLLRQVMWRTSKTDVEKTELELPPQIVEHVRIQFGPVENFHYSSLQQAVRTETSRYNGLSRGNDAGLSMSSELLLTLRQACCHPQIGSSGRTLNSRARLALRRSGLLPTRRENAIQKATKRAQSPMDMGEVLEALVTKANLEGQDALRSVVSSSNGLAAVCLLQYSLLRPSTTNVESLITAVQLYRESLRLAEENKDVVKLDDIQKMHVLFNLKDALEVATKKRLSLMSKSSRSSSQEEALAKLASVGQTTRDHNLLAEMEELKARYVSEAEMFLSSNTVTYRNVSEDLGDEPLIAKDEMLSDEDENEHEKEIENGVEMENKNEDEADGDIVISGNLGKNDKIAWWQVALAAVLEERKEEEFLARVVEKLLAHLPDRGAGMRTLTTRLTHFHSLGLVISCELRGLQDARMKFRQKLFKLPGSRPPTDEEIAESGQCHTCREFGTGSQCKHCSSERFILNVERKMYFLREDLDEEDDFSSDDEMNDQAGIVDGPPSRLDPSIIVKGAFQANARSSKWASQSSRIYFQSEVEVILNTLASVVRRKVKDDRVVEEMNAWFARLAKMKEEHAEAKRVFECQRALLARMDEVKMALMRLSVLDDDIDVNSLPELEARHRVPRDSLATLNVQFSNEKAAAELEFCTKRGSLVYLRSLKRSTQEGNLNGKRKRDCGIEFQSCAVCLAEFGEAFVRIAVWTCGHVFCCDCTLSIIKKVELRSRMEAIRCPTCRVQCPVDDINFTSITPPPSSKRRRPNQGSQSTFPSSESSDENEDLLSGDTRKKKAKEDVSKQRKERASTFYDPNVEVFGHFGAKASALIRLLRGIWRDDSQKVIIFSEWGEVLSLVRNALTRNNILFCYGANRTSSGLSKLVEEFKSSPNKNVIVLPLKRGGAGLNLTEAKHVILMEPSMNISLEKQAIGRIHRIGQQHTTYVHRILVNDTVEDKILCLGDVHRDNRSSAEQTEATIPLQDVIGALQSIPS